MGFLKGFGTFVLGFLLFLSLSVFGTAFLLNSTLLNPDFIKKQVDRVDISAVARDVADPEIKKDLPPELNFLKDAVYNVIDAQEPWLKAQADQTIDTAYDFFLGKTDKLAIKVPLNALKTDLKNSLWQELNKQLTVWLRDNIQSELKPYIEQNLKEYRKYLPAELNLLSDAQLKSYLDLYLGQVQDQIVKTGQSPALSGLLETLVRPYFDYYYDEYAAEIPDQLVADESNIPAGVMDNLLLARKYIGYFRSAYYWLIGFMVLLVAGIFLIYRNVPDPSRALGIDLFIFGALDLAGVLVVRSFNPVPSLLNSMPQKMPSLEPWLYALYQDVTGKMLMFSIVILAVGIALIVISFIFKKKPAEA